MHDVRWEQWRAIGQGDTRGNAARRWRGTAARAGKYTRTYISWAILLFEFFGYCWNVLGDVARVIVLVRLISASKR